jgi:hypothetical protein
MVSFFRDLVIKKRTSNIQLAKGEQALVRITWKPISNALTSQWMDIKRVESNGDVE